MSIFTYQVRKRGADFEIHPTNRELYRRFVEQLEEDTLVEVIMEVRREDASLSQLSYVHYCIRELAKHTGNTFHDMKLLVKDRAGLCLVRELEGREYFTCKSFGQCSREELTLAIEACYELAAKTGFTGLR